MRQVMPSLTFGTFALSVVAFYTNYFSLTATIHLPNLRCAFILFSLICLYIVASFLPVVSWYSLTVIHFM